MSQVWKSIQENWQPNVKLYVVAGASTVWLVYFLRRAMIRSNISRKIQRKQKQCKAVFDKIEQDLKNLHLSSDGTTQIIALSLSELQARLQDGTLRAVDVLHAYQSQALEVNKRLNCVTEPLLSAQAAAEACDGSTGEKGLLHGIPISLKESFNLKNLDCTMGLGQYIGHPMPEDAVLVKVVKRQGAIPFVRTNIPQVMMSYECANPVYGRTDNPHDPTRTPGGSTGGEGALLASRGSILGMGTDIGGSIRIPCHYSGCYGLKTTTERLSRKGMASLSKGQTLVSGTVGPMARDVDGLVLIMKAILCDYQFELDPSIPPIPFRDEMYESKRPLRVGYYVNDGYIPAIPACRRAVLMAKRALEHQGHTVVDFTPPRIKHAYPNYYIKSVCGDGGQIFTSKMDKDIADPYMHTFLMSTKWPRCLQRLLAYVIQIIGKDPVQGDVLRAKIGLSSVNEWYNHVENVKSYQHEFHDTWKAQGLDAVICPVSATVAVPHGQVGRVLAGGFYSMLYNIVNYPAGALPVTKVTQDDVTNMAHYPSTTLTEKLVRKAMEGSAGLPVAVQCVGRPFQEELVLRLMKEVETGLQSL